MSNIVYTFSPTTLSAQYTSPLTITFDPTSLGFTSKIIYGFPDKTITRVFTLAPSAEALTTYKDIDTRAPLVYTFPGEDISDDGTTTKVVSITAFAGNSQATTVYTISANIILQHLTKNPTGASNSYAFEEVHLLKTRVWGAGNSQIFVLETKSPNYLLLNFNSGNQIPAVTNVPHQ